MQKKKKSVRKIDEIPIPESYFSGYYVPDESHHVSDATIARRHKRLTQWLKDHPENNSNTKKGENE